MVCSINARKPGIAPIPKAITKMTAHASSGMVRRKATSTRTATRSGAGDQALLAATNPSRVAIATATSVDASASCSVSQISGSCIGRR